ncbi:MAG: crossover junction endodeoxyribonuclease RuvC [Bacteroidia bacterium]
MGTLLWGVDIGLRALGVAGLRPPREVVFTHLITPPPQSTEKQKFFHLHQELHKLAGTYPPDAIVWETPFVGKNIRSALQLGRVEGILWSLCAEKGISLYLYAPAQIKKALTGNPYASKEQLKGFLQQYLPHCSLPTSSHLTDALGIALCHMLRNRL